MPSTLSISITVGSTSGAYRPSSIPKMSPPGCAGSWWEKDRLDEGKIEDLVASLRALETSHSGLAKDIETQADYFEGNKERMRYAKFRKQGLFVGSGVVEASCKTVIGRLKRSGMFWTVRGANAIIALRCCQLSGNFEDYWEARRA